MVTLRGRGKLLLEKKCAAAVAMLGGCWDQLDGELKD